jgi:hypothetical protein
VKPIETGPPVVIEGQEYPYSEVIDTLNYGTPPLYPLIAWNWAQYPELRKMARVYHPKIIVETARALELCPE